MSRLAYAVFALVAAVFFAPATASAVDIEIGLEGHFRIGQWTPVRVTGVSESSAAILCTDPTGLVVKYPLEKSDDAYVGLVQFANVTSRCMIIAGEAETPLAKFVPSRSGVGTPHRSSNRVWLVDSSEIDFNSARDRFNEFADEPDRASIVRSDVSDTSKDVQSLADALSAVNLVVLSKPVEENTAAALRRWVADGGHLLIAGGLNEDFETNSALAKWLPIKVEGAARFRDLNVLEASVPTGRNLRLKRPLNGVRLATDTGNEDIKSSFGPILVRAPYGFGRVSVFALDLSEAVFQEWNSLPALCLILADERLQTAGTGSPSQNRLTRTGVGEFETQLLATVDNAFDEGREQTPLWKILGRLVLYGFLIAAVDYVLVHRVLRLPQLTWLTMPAWAIGVFAFVAVSSNGSTSDEGESSVSTVSMTSLSVSDIDIASGYARTRSFVSVGKNDRSRISPRLADAFETSTLGSRLAERVSERRLGWTAPPEENFGGRYRSQQIELDGLAYEAGLNREQFTGIPVEPKGTRLFESTRRFDLADSDSVEPLVEFDIEMRGVRPFGTITSRLPSPVENWSFAIGRQIVFPREPTPLVPNQPFRVDLQSCDSRALRDVITGIRRGVEPKETSATGGRSIAEREEYDPTALDPGRLMRTATFYERAGGISFAGVRNSGSPIGFDLSHMLEFKRVVFLGTLAGVVSPITLQDDENPASAKQYDLCFLRVISPLKSSE